MPEVSGTQLFTEMANKIWITRKLTSPDQEIGLELGVIRQPSTPSIQTDPYELNDPASNNAVVARGSNASAETWVAKVANFNMDNFALFFLGMPPTTIEQTATEVAAVLHANQTVGSLIMVKDAGGNKALNIGSFGTVADTSGPTTLAADDDYEVVDLEAGIIRLLAGGTASLTAGATVNVEITYTPTAIDMLSINPLDVTQVNCDAAIQMQSPDGAHKWMRAGKATIEPSATNFTNTDFSDWDFTVTMLTDTTLTAAKAGKLTKFKGTQI